MDVAQLHEYTSELEQRWWKAGGQGWVGSEGGRDGAGDRQRQERKEGRSYHDTQKVATLIEMTQICQDILAGQTKSVP